MRALFDEPKRLIGLRSQVIMDSWTHQLGFPLITLRRHGNVVHATQRHFLLLNSSGQANSTQKWYVPLSFVTSAAPANETQIWMHGKDGNEPLAKLGDSQFQLISLALSYDQLY